MKSLIDVLNFLFGCRHRQKSGVFTIKKRSYRVCLMCGQEFERVLAQDRSVRQSRRRNSDRTLIENCELYCSDAKARSVSLFNSLSV